MSLIKWIKTWASNEKEVAEAHKDIKALEIKALETWVVRWKAPDHYTTLYAIHVDHVEVFITEDDARKFKEKLTEAFKLVRSSGYSGRIDISKNK